MSTYLAANKQLTFAEIEALWIHAGGSPAWAATMAGIAMAESGGNTAVLNDNRHTKDYSVGLWQINYFNGLLASRTSSYGAPAALAASPGAQATAAVEILGGGPGISAWAGDLVGQQAINNGNRPISLGQIISTLSGSVSAASLKGATDLTNATPATLASWWGWGHDWAGDLGKLGQAAGSSPPGKAIAGAADAVGASATFFADITSKALWIRVGEGALGAALIIGGLVIFFASTTEGKKITSDAASAASVAALA